MEAKGDEIIIRISEDKNREYYVVVDIKTTAAAESTSEWEMKTVVTRSNKREEMIIKRGSFPTPPTATWIGPASDKSPITVTVSFAVDGVVKSQLDATRVPEVVK